MYDMVFFCDVSCMLNVFVYFVNFMGVGDLYYVVIFCVDCVFGLQCGGFFLFVGDCVDVVVMDVVCVGLVVYLCFVCFMFVVWYCLFVCWFFVGC